MPEDSGVVVVTLADIFKAQNDMAIKLAEIGGALALQSQQHRNDGATLADHETRIRKVEVKVYSIPAAPTILSLAALAWAVISKH